MTDFISTGRQTLHPDEPSAKRRNSKKQLSMFESERLSIHDAKSLSLESLREYGERYKHWAVAFSGGKDSTATVTLIAHLIETGQLRAPSSLHVLFADTRLELPPLFNSAMRILERLESRGLAQTRVVLPVLERRFFVFMFGRGVPPSHSGFRWCTGGLKVDPMNTALKELRDETGEKFLMITGVRLGESAQRDARIAVSCSKDSGECGQGYFQQMTPASVADVLAPLVHWRTCFVWDWLMGFEGDHAFDCRDVAAVYGQDDEGSLIERDARTGCVGCPVASKDTALETVLRNPTWAFLSPLKQLRPLYQWLSKPTNRLRRDGATFGPLVMEARMEGLKQVLEIQHQVNAGALRDGRPLVSLINDEEQSRILELIQANTWPDKWTGAETRGDQILPLMPVKGGGFQHTMIEALEGP